MLFSEVVGQEKVKQKLIQTVLNERISHAQLFQGKLGYGGFPMALAYARFVLCSNKTENDSCGTCPSCLKVNSLSHPDLHFSFPVQLLKNMEKSDDFLAEWKEMMIENPYSNEQDWYVKNENEKKKGIIGVKESKSIFDKLSLKSFEGGYKISIIWLADNMNIQSANKLLKLIEEPPNDTLIMLVAEDLEKIISTIISRTQVVKLSPLSMNEISSELVSRLNLEQGKSQEIAGFSEGDFSLATTEALNADTVHDFFDFFVTWMRLCFKKDVAGAVTFSANMQKLGKEKQKSFLLFVLGIFQKSLTGNFIGIEQVQTSPAYVDFIKKFMPFIHERNIESLHQEMSEAHYHIDRNANAKILFLDLSFTLFKLIKK